MEKVSIVIPIYNAMPYLEQCIESVLAQSFKDFKVFLVDDGSTDGSGQVCEQYRRVDDRICVYHQTNRGVGSARNKGLELAQGKYIMFIDPDDWIESNLLEEVFEKAEREKVDLVIWSLTTMVYNQKGQLIRKTEVKAKDHIWNTEKECISGFLDIAKGNDLLLGVPWNKFYRRDIIEKYHLRFSKLRRRQDIIFNLDYYKYIKSLSITGQTYSNYRVIDKPFASTMYRDFVDIAIRVYQKYKELFNYWGNYSGENKQFVEYYFLSNILRIMGDCTNPKWQWSLVRRYRYIGGIMRREEVQRVVKDFSYENKSKGIRHWINRRKIKWLNKRSALLMLITIYIEKFYQDIRYYRRNKREMGEVR